MGADDNDDDNDELLCVCVFTSIHREGFICLD